MSNISNSIVAVGTNSLAGAKIYFSNASESLGIDIYDTGSELDTFDIYCHDSSICKIYCHSKNSCTKLILHCYGLCYTRCDDIDINCPLYGSYVTWDSDEPTKKPSIETVTIEPASVTIAAATHVQMTAETQVFTTSQITMNSTISFEPTATQHQNDEWLSDEAFVLAMVILAPVLLVICSVYFCEHKNKRHNEYEQQGIEIAVVDTKIANSNTGIVSDDQPLVKVINIEDEVAIYQREGQ